MVFVNWGMSKVKASLLKLGGRKALLSDIQGF